MDLFRREIIEKLIKVNIYANEIKEIKCKD